MSPNWSVLTMPGPTPACLSVSVRSATRGSSGSPVTAIHSTTVGWPSAFEYTPWMRKAGSSTFAMSTGACWRATRSSTLSVSHSIIGCRSLR